ncbi:hypothetical protein HYPSUDRAFT_569461 [Hypholoma sublateritium FD-334 SS-4]|uniref:Uncharacterized protein n=1 Tax=Hypholoma sublateritium (strain FD-334 SS-4) TaxID=945553 RepID=A0A0D2P4Y3_HYPSF|nr:hypothetical protein HYPSUDRAFT_569461 [Hypholoma sublateritium FD-334 SS-4]
MLHGCLRPISQRLLSESAYTRNGVKNRRKRLASRISVILAQIFLLLRIYRRCLGHPYIKAAQPSWTWICPLRIQSALDRM